LARRSGGNLGDGLAKWDHYRRIRADPADWFDRVEIEKARAYNRGLQWNRVVTLCLASAWLVGWIAGRVAHRVVESVGVRNWALQVLLINVLLVAGFSLLTLPLDVLRDRHNRRWLPIGRKPFLVEESQELLAAVIVVPVVLLGLWSLIRITHLWWVYTSAVAVIFAFVGLIEPIFFTRGKKLDDKDLRTRIRRLAREAGVDVVDVFVTPASDDAQRPGSQIAGFGPTRRIVVAADIVARPQREVDVLIARHLSAWKRRKQGKRFFLTAVLFPVMFLVVHIAVSWEPLRDLAGVGPLEDPASVPLFVLVLIPAFLLLLLTISLQNRANVRRADLDALEFTRDVDAFESAIRVMHARGMTRLAPSFLQRIRSSSPPPAERLAMAARWRTSRRVTVLFTDVEDSTPLLERLGDEGWFDLLRDHNEILRSNVSRHGGIETGSAGDGFLFVFEDAGEALLCAIDGQRALETYGREHEEPIRVRMGLHTGEVIRTGNSVIGREVHLAARISAAARGGQILASNDVRAALEDTGRFRFVDDRELELKGLSGTHRVSDVDWRETALSPDPSGVRAG
jgi:class 3 adenylate cyclase